MKDFEFLKTKELKKAGSTKLGDLQFDTKSRKLFVKLKSSVTDADLLKVGFYFVVSEKTVLSVNHVGVQKKPRGFKEVLTRLNNPRTEQNTEFSNVLLASVLRSNKVVRETPYSVVYMTYSQVYAMLGLDEYNSKNNGLELIGKLREFNIPSRTLC